MQRAILHLDADAFFASVEQATDARLRGQPVAVGGQKRGIIASASYEARRFGIYTPMPTVQARRLCPRLILLPGDFEKYELFSRLMFSYAYDFTPDVEIGSIDEGYLDISGARQPAVTIGETIRRAIRQSLKLSVSEGIGSNKLISQIASKLRKPDAFQAVPAGFEAQFLSPLANQWLPGIGPKTANQLNAAGLARIGQIAQTPADLLGLLVGSLAPQLCRFARGIDERPVIPARAPAKSYGEQQTFAADTTDERFLEATLQRMADKLMARVREDGKSIRTLTVKVRYNDMDEAQASESIHEPTDLETEVYGMVSSLLRKAWKRRVSLRLVALRLSNVYDGSFRSVLGLDSPARKHAANEKLAGAVDELRHKFGRGVLLRGHDFVLQQGDRPEVRSRRSALKPKINGPAKSSPDRATNSSLLNTHLQVGGAADHGKSPKPFQRFPPSHPQKSTPQQLHEAAADYKIAVVQRQRLGNSAARQPPDGKARQIIHTAPGPELRFRIAPEQQPPPPAVRRRCSTHYVPLNVHSYYSFLDSTLSIKAIVELAQRYELPAIALTDTRNLHGAVEFARQTAQAGIKPIIGAELQWNGQRLVLYVENQTGYHNLCRILSTPPDGDSSRSRRQQALTSGEQTSQRLLTSTATQWGNTEGLLAVSPAAALAPLFPQRFYLEIQHPQQLSDRHPPLPCVASFPIHYSSPADRWKYDVVQSIRTLTLLRQQHPQKRLDGEYHFPAPAQLQRRFAAHPQCIAHSRELAERCHFEFSLGRPQFPAFTAPPGFTSAGFLRHLVMEGLQRRYPRDPARHRPQLEQELAIITDVGYEEYFLVMWDLLQSCRRRGIEWITRGSAADSLACYCLEISGVCPIRFDLYFRRFLNKDRMALNKLPDIDVDFAHDRKDDVIDLIFEKYGPVHTAVVGGFSTFQSRSAFAEVAKVLGVSDFQARRITERLPHFSRAAELAEAVAESRECHDLPLAEEPYQTALHLAHFLDGFPRYAKMHPCGLVLSRQPMNEITPCFTSAKGYPTTHFDMDSVEAVGLVKMDILAQGGLAVMRDVSDELGRRQERDIHVASTSDSFPTSGLERMHSSNTALNRHECRAPLAAERIDFDALEPWQDPQVWQLIATGQARAVHHIESPAMISLCKMCNVQDIDTLIAIVSVIRPGAANESKKMEFARRYQGLSQVEYPHPSLEPCLRSTYGLVVYEEHILQICEAFAGLPPGRADVLRRALAKDKTELIGEIQAQFAACARQRGRTEAQITEVWGLVTGFKGYAFCKAHSTAYGVEAYQSAWLKRYYPVEFMAAVLTNGKGFYNPLVYVLECHRLRIALLPPSVNDPGPLFAVRAGKIRVPVLQVKGLTTRTRETILRERQRGEFVSLPDFMSRVQPLGEEMEALIQAGAFDGFGQKRTTQYWEFKSRPLARGGSGPAQLELFRPGNLQRLPAVPLAQPDRLQRLRWEEELLGYPVSGHPLELYPEVAWETYCPIDRLGDHIGEQIVTCGLVIEQRLFHQITGEPMKFLTIADWTGMVETELFARTYRSYALSTIRYRVLEIAATVEAFENGRGFTLRVLRAGKPRTKTR